jgi:hypothetical protein
MNMSALDQIAKEMKKEQKTRRGPGLERGRSGGGDRATRPLALRGASADHPPVLDRAESE